MLHTPNGRYTNDVKIAEAVAQMLTRVGIETSIEALPPATFFTRASTGGPGGGPEFSFILVGWSAGTGEASGSVKPLVNTFDRATGRGATNRGRYSNAEVDKLTDEALQTNDDPSAPRCSPRPPRSPSTTWRSSRCTTRSAPGPPARA